MFTSLPKTETNQSCGSLSFVICEHTSPGAVELSSLHFVILVVIRVPLADEGGSSS
ncbi:hypothetical protein [Candidatus Nitrosocosmicus oleophilus]|uniref:hypothetical protein n=1 Tax=Candidatus Nitrosocosmicus oleophilus TaxID=1353260 RepID=UPI0018CB91AF|nr:hypothetical protein [Candidatus Nitrosocosmicus oleophilus]